MQAKKIVVIGPESTGKSSLCASLAQHYQSEWLPEYAREYLLKNGKDYKYQDLVKIAEGQVESETSFLQSQSSAHQSVLFLDTDLYVIKIWSEYVFNSCENRILTQIAKRNYDLYLLCDIDLPWIADELREYPDYESRLKLFHYYQDALVNQHVPWRIVNGNNQTRVDLAIRHIDEWLKLF
jgi:NadR type nicotinamide-nucleotide adenylyltransferase